MSLQFSPTMPLVMQAFQNVGLSQTQSYNADQLCTGLDKLSGQPYDREVAKQLFEQCETNQRGQVNLESFATVVLEADKILKKKIVGAEDQVQQYLTEQRECQTAAREEQQHQQLNTLGVDKDSQLSIAIRNAQNIQFSQDFINSFVNIFVDQTTQSTPPSTGSDKFNPQFNKQLQFQIVTGSEEVVLQLCVYDRQQQKQLIGQAHIDLGQIYDQQVHSLNLQLLNQNGHNTNTYVNIEAQWIHNKLKYHQDLVSRYDQAIQTLRADIEDYKRDLLVIQQPFLESNQRRSLQQSLHPQQQAQQASIPFSAQQYQQRQVQQNTFQQSTIPYQDQVQGTGEITDELHYGLMLYLISLLLATFQCFARPAYFDVLLGMLFIIIIIRDCFEPTYIKIVGGVNVASLILDIFWIMYYKNWWNGTDKNLPTWGEAGDSIVRMAFMFCIFNLIIKSALCYFLYHYYLASQKEQVIVFTLYNLEFTVGQQKKNLFQLQRELLA